jgi:endonuclease/exonuclease/phosphatase family metal-dependent hydrolase
MLETMTSTARGLHERSDARSKVLTIASYNLHSCVGWDRKRSPARIVQVLRELDCDIYALQEVDNQPGEHEESMQLEYLSKALDMAAVPGLRIVRHTGEYGNALLTRLPIVHVRRHDLSYSRAEPRGALDVELDLRGKPLRIIATHLGLRRTERRFQWRRLMIAIGEGSMEAPLIVIGDMNEWYRRAATLREAHLAFGKPPAPAGFPSFAPLLALTRIWVRPHSAIESVVIHRSRLARQASDHLPLKAVLDVGKLMKG